MSTNTAGLLDGDEVEDGEVDDAVYRWALVLQVVDDGQLDFDVVYMLGGGKE